MKRPLTGFGGTCSWYY